MAGETTPAAVAARKRELLRRLLAAEGLASTRERITRRAPDARVPLSSPQQQMWLLQQIAPDSAAYNLTLALRLSGSVDAVDLERALQAVVERHEILRTVYLAGPDGIPEPVVTTRTVPLAKGQSPADAEKLAALPFDLARDLPLRAMLVELADSDQLLVLVLHHIATDERAWEIVLSDLATAYRGETLAPAPLQYGDVTIWQKTHPISSDADLEYWVDRLTPTPEPLRLPADLPRTARAADRGGLLHHDLPAGIANKIAEFGKREGVTPFMILLAGFSALLHRYCESTDITIGSPTVNRDDPDLAEVVGHFGNTLALRTDVSGNPTFTELVKRVRTGSTGDYAHQKVPFETVVEAVHPDRTTGSVLFDVLFSVRTELAAQLNIPGVTVETWPLHNGTAMLDLSVDVITATSGWKLEATYRDAVFSGPAVTRLLDQFGRLLDSLLEEPDRPLGDFALGTDDEASGPRLANTGRLVTDAFAEQARRTPDATALVCSGTSLSFADLDVQVTALAGWLAAHGAGPERVVALQIPRSADLIVALLAVLRSGAAYLPIDPMLPSERIDFLIANAQPAVVLTELPTVDTTAELATVLPDNPAYVLYTSGTTGRPKGVVVTHRGLANMLANHSAVLFNRPRMRVALTAALSFDTSWEGLLAMVCGHELHLIDDDTRRDPALLTNYVRANGIGLLDLTPTFAHQAVAEGLLSGAHTPSVLMLGGEASSPELWTELAEAPDTVGYNFYGPTECTVDALWSTVSTTIPLIGRPVANTTAHILDAYLQPVPVDAPGELYLAGPHVARGYLGQPGLTSTRFVAGPNGRMYRTGDRARRLADGTVEYLGRTDFQLKIRGYRIEPGEVEAALLSHPSVSAAAVVAKSETLVAYVVGNTAGLREHAAAQLPAYMVPSAFVELEALPLTANGKLDTRALPDPVATVATGRSPRNAREELLCGLFAEVLGLASVTIDDNFFHLGGHSLLAARLSAKIRTQLQSEMPVSLLFDAPTVANLAPRLSGTTSRPALTRATRPEQVPLSPGQQRLWFLDRLDGPSTRYTIPFRLHLDGTLDESALMLALSDVIDRHEVLRTVIREDRNGTPYQQILDRNDVAAVSAEPFDLTEELPVRATLSGNTLEVQLHHIASDEWSIGPMLRDLATAYRARLDRSAPTWAALPVQYADYTLWQRRLFDELGAEQLEYWKRQLAGVPSRIELPTLCTPTLIPGGASTSITVPGPLADQLSALAKNTTTTMFMVMQAALVALLSRLGAGSDIPLGTPVHGRSDAALDDLAGFFVNTVVLRTSTAGTPTFSELLARVRDTSLAAFDHQDVPFDAVVEAVNPERNAEWNPLFQVFFSYLDQVESDLDMGDLNTSVEFLDPGGSKFDLSVNFAHGSAGIEGRVVYRTDMFDEDSVRTIIDRLLRLLSSAAANPDLPISDLEILSAGEKHDLLTVWNDMDSGYELATVPELFNAHVRRNPGATAVICDDELITYSELDQRATRLARVLAAHGAGPEKVVAVALPRSIDLIVSLVAVLKSGSAYLALDVDYPTERLEYMADDAQPVALVSHDFTLPNVPRIRPDASGPHGPIRSPRVDNAAYVIYTSGSTGRPKGVVVTHSGVAKLLATQEIRLDVTTESRVLFHASPSFDLAFWELCQALLSGAALVVVPTEKRIPGPILADYINTHRVTQMALPPSVLSAFPPDCDLPQDVSMLVGTEAVAPALVERWATGRRMFNAYGPTEVTVNSTLGLCRTGRSAVPIGIPDPDTKAYILDANLTLVPAGVVGELYLTGPGLARGYHGRPGITSDRFVACPFEPGRMYRTGDLCRWTTDGEIDYLGRVDHQVKIRGHRIELGEIEAVIDRFPGVTRTLGVVREDEPGRKQLVAYVAGSSLDSASLRAHVRESLPEYMVPSAFVLVDRLPTLPNGKLDRSALPVPDYSAHTGTVAPRNDRERAFCDLFARVLGLPDVGAEDSFFDLGGDSIVSIQLVSQARQAGWAISARDVFTQKTVAGIAQTARKVETAVHASDGVGEVLLTPVMRAALDNPDLDSFHQYVVLDVPGLTFTDAHTVVSALLAHHDVLRARLDENLTVTADARVHLVSSHGSLDDEIAYAAARLRPRDGVMLHAVWAPDQLALVAHHLVVDAVSWRIIAEDVKTAVQAIHTGSDIRLAPVSTSFRTWSQRLHERATDSAGDLDRWVSTLDGVPDLFRAGNRTVHRVVLSADETAPLLTAPAAFHGGTQDLILTALVRAIGRWHGQEIDVLVDVESHGRSSDADVSRTVGWFTEVHPVRVSTNATVKEVKELLRADGSTFGLLRWINPDTAGILAELPRAQILVNYLGRVDSGEEFGGGEDVESGSHAIELNAGVVGGELVANWLCDQSLTGLIPLWQEALAELAASSVTGHTPSDFALVRVTQREIDDLEAKGPLADLLPVSPLQTGLLFHADAYHVEQKIELAGPLDENRLRGAIERTLVRHPNLRAGFTTLSNGPVQFIPAQVNLVWSRDTAFDLAEPPLFRAHLESLAADRHLLTITTHHILMDGWSTPLLISEILSAYDGVTLPAAPRYADYLEWVGQQDRSAAETAWAASLSGIDGATRLASGQVSAAKPLEAMVDLDRTLTEAITSQARTHGLTLNTVVQGCWALLLSHLTGRDDVVFGQTTSGREADVPGIESIIGLLINTLPVRVRLEPRESLAELLTRVQSEQTRLLGHQHLGLGDLQRLAGVGELFDTLVVFESFPIDRDSVEREVLGMRVADVDIADDTHYPATLTINPGEQLHVQLSYLPEAVDGESVLARFVGLLEAFAESPANCSIDVLTVAERAQLEFCAGPTVTTLVHEEVAHRTDDATALVYQDERVAFGEFNERVNRLAGWLAHHGAGPEQTVAIELPRGTELIIALFGVLRSGAASLTIDPELPADRRALMLTDSAAAIVVTEAVFAEAMDSALEAPSVAIHPDNAAYLIYTSGSTGTPKAVVVPHRGLANLFASHSVELFADHERIALTAALTFDTAWEELLAIPAGRELHVIDDVTRHDPQLLTSYVAEHGIDLVDLTPTFAHQAIAAGLLTNRPPKSLILGGEAADQALWTTLRDSPATRGYNCYGPTEATVDALTCEIDSARPVIGRALPNTAVYVLDSHLRPVPTGVTGEIYLAGPHLARGYRNQAGLTAARFIANPFGNGRMYRTGDIGRWTSNGVEYQGRADDQLKIRGFRIEPGEIEAVLATHPSVAQVAVVGRGNPTRLVAYVVAPETAGLREHAAAALPDYMVPAAFVALDALPLTSHGKLDHRALPEPDFASLTTAIAPRNDTEVVLCAAFADILGLPDVGAEDNFFALGGDSISSIMLVSKLRTIGYATSPREVFRNPTPAALALVIRQDEVGAIADSGVGLVPETPMAAWLRGLGTPIGRYAQTALVRTPSAATAGELERALQAVVDQHDMLRASLVRGDTWSLNVPAPGVQVNLREIAVTGDLRQHIAAAAEDAFSALDPDRGVMIQAVWFNRGDNRPGRLLLVIHHLVVDAVSWRIILGDLASAWTSISTGQEPALAAVPVSFRTWAQSVSAREWPKLAAIDAEIDTAATAQDLVLELPANVTEPLLTTIPAAFHAGVEDVLLTALALAMAERSSAPVLIDLESHGRDDDAGLDRTVGWFTAINPVALTPGEGDVGTVLKRIKEQLRHRAVVSEKPEIGFNYLGRVGAAAESTDWDTAAEADAVPDGFDLSMPADHLLELNAITEDRPEGPVLRATWSWPRRLLSEAEVRALGESWFVHLNAIVVDTQGPDAGGYTPSDLDLVSLSQEEIEEFEAEWA